MEEEILVTETMLRKAFDIWLKEIIESPNLWAADIDWKNPPDDYSKVAAENMFRILKKDEVYE